MTVNPDEGHTGLDRDNNQRPDVNQEGGEDSPRTDAFQERMDDLTEAAKDSKDR